MQVESPAAPSASSLSLEARGPSCSAPSALAHPATAISDATPIHALFRVICASSLRRSAFHPEVALFLGPSDRRPAQRMLNFGPSDCRPAQRMLNFGPSDCRPAQRMLNSIEPGRHSHDRPDAAELIDL